MLSNTAKKHLFYLACLLLVVSYSYLLIFGDGGLIKLKQEEKRLIEAAKTMQKEEAKSRELQKNIDLIKNDRKEFEKIAREKYKMAKPGEIIVNIDTGEEKNKSEN